MRKKFCPRCGKVVEKLYNNLCEECISKKTYLADKVPNTIKIKKCRSCGKYYISKKRFESLESVVGDHLSELFKNSKASFVNFRILNNRLHVSIKLKIDDFEKSESKESELLSKVITCESCSKQKVGYFQSTLQIRASAELLERIKNYIEDQIFLLNKKDKLAFISKYQKVKNGFDMNIGSKFAANNLSKRLKNKFRANLKISRKLSGSISGKKVYRDTILVKIGE